MGDYPSSFSKKGLLKELIILAAPIALHNLIQSCVGIVDVLMVGQINNESLATVGIANQVFFMVCVAIFGIASGGAVFITRAWGAQNISQIQRFTAISLFVCLFLAILLGITSYLRAYDTLYFFSANPFLSVYGKNYLEITSVSFLFTAFTIVLAVQLRCVGKGHLAMWAGGSSLLVNALLNYLFIFGPFEFVPAMGLTGAAIATLTARAIETCITIYFFLYRNPARGPFKAYFSITSKDKAEDIKVFHAFVKIALPIVLIELLWAVGQGVYKIVFARMGISPLAAYTVLETLINFFSAGVIGFSNAAGVLMGYKLGVPDVPLARKYASYFIRTNFILAIPLSILLALSSFFLPDLFRMGPKETIFLKQGLYICAFFLSFKSYNFLMSTGIMRVAGDGKFVSVASSFSFIGFGIPLALVGGLALKWGFFTILCIVFIEENIRNLILWRRYKSGNWMHEIVKL
ncbi:MAG: MATE family efflux transporter [Spirochaetia bacterium]